MNHPAATARRILMCPPDFYGIHYEINPWMDRRHVVDHARAVGQWQALYEILLDCGAVVERLEPVAGLPDLVFTANAALIYRTTAFLSRFRHEQRQHEVLHDEAWFAAGGFETVHLPEPNWHFEGAGDALFCGETLFAGYRIRSDARGHQWLAAQIGCRVLPLELVDPRFYHLDTCFCPLSPDTAIYFPGAFDQYGQRALAESGIELIELDEVEACRFAANAVVLGRHVVTNIGCPRLHRTLQDRGYDPIATPLDEFIKSGGSAKCLTLRLDGEDAAAWRND